jgi:protein disulfide-isomerase
MRKALAFLGIVATATLALNLQAEPKWLTDFEAVKKEAAKENKAILMDFTGSDWCPPCKALKKNVLDKPEFEKFAGEKLVLIELDFPNDKKKVTKEVAASNAKLSKEFKIDGYPTIIVLDKEGKELGRMVGYGGEAPAAYIKKLEAFLAKAK